MATTQPQWKPLEDLVGGQAYNFMYVGTAEGRYGQTIYLYKHEDTRRYLNIDEQGECYRFETVNAPGGDGVYIPIPQEQAIAHAFS